MSLHLVSVSALFSVSYEQLQLRRPFALRLPAPKARSFQQSEIELRITKVTPGRLQNAQKLHPVSMVVTVNKPKSLPPILNLRLQCQQETLALLRVGGFLP